MIWIVIFPSISESGAKDIRQFNTKEETIKYLSSANRDISRVKIFEAKEKLLVVNIEDKPDATL